MGRCRNCHTHFWGNPHFCPSCKTDLWYEEYNDENWDFRALQEEGNRLIAKGNYEKAAVVLKLALDQVMYKHAQHSMHRLKDAVSDFVWLYSNEAADISDDRITDVLDYFEEECFGQPDKYRENLMQMRRDASRRLPQAQYREKQGLDFPHLRSYWEFAPVSQVTDHNSVSGYEPDILEAKHLLLTESFLYLYLNFSRVMKYLQAQDSLNTQMVTDELLPLLHPDLDMEKNGENDTAKLMENVLCGFLEDGFEELASLYLNHFDEAAVTKVKKRCEQIAGEDVTSTAMLEYNNDIITLTIGSETAYFNDNANTLDTAPQIINDRIMLPIRFIAESFKFDVEWEQGTQTITIKSNTLNPTVTTEPTIAPDNQTNGSKALVVYYSASGTTEKIAKYIANAANADIFEIQPVEPYTADDLEKIFREENINPDELQNMVVEKLTKNNLKLATAESCTGGLLSGRITAVSGASEVFDCGVCSYANEIKHKVLGVSEETLNTLGAVSPETALQMAEGVKKLANADISASTTGLAGPTGGTDEKPVGLVLVGI